MANAMLEKELKSSQPDLRMVAASFRNEEHESRAAEDQKPSASAGRRTTVDYHNHGSNNHHSTGSNHSHQTVTKLSPCRKSVEFLIQPQFPSKRARICTEEEEVPWTAKQVVEAVSTSISPAERCEAIGKARDAFGHDVQALHDEEMATGADAALVKHLSFLVWSAENNHVGCDHPAQPPLFEISTTCQAMESLYKASSHIVGASFERMGTVVMQLMVRLIDGELQRRVVHQPAVQQEPHPNQEQYREQQQDPHYEVGDGGSRTHHVNVKQEQNGTNDQEQQQQRQQQQQQQRQQQHAHMDETEAAAMLPPAAVHSNADASTSGGRRSITPPPVSPPSMRGVMGTEEGDVLLRKTTKILGHYCRVGRATYAVARYPGLLNRLIHLITLQPYDCVPWEARLSALWTLANLACNGDNMQMMVACPGLVQSLVLTACRQLRPGVDSLETTMEVLRSRAIACRCILNLSWKPENKILLSEQAPVVDMLTELSVYRKAPGAALRKSRTVREVLVATRRHAVGALRNLAAAPRRTKIGLCDYKNGLILDSLTDGALNDDDPQVRDRALAAIHNLAVHDTAVKMVSHPALVLALKDVLLEENGGASADHGGAAAGGEDDSRRRQENAYRQPCRPPPPPPGEDGPSLSPRDTPKSHASATLMVLERSITPEMGDSYDNLRDLLEAIHPTTSCDDEENACYGVGCDDVDDNERRIPDDDCNSNIHNRHQQQHDQNFCQQNDEGDSSDMDAIQTTAV